MTPLTSSMFSEYGYDADSQTLALRYSTGQLYHYTPVTQEQMNALTSAESFGKAFHAVVKPLVKSGEITATLVKEPPEGWPAPPPVQGYST